MSIDAKFLIGGLMVASAAMFSAQTASASPLPNPDPGIPVPGVEGENTGVTNAPLTEGEMRVSAPSVGGEASSTTGGFENPAETVPNINGTPCTGGFESTVCYAEQMGDSPEAVQPRSEISASP